MKHSAPVPCFECGRPASNEHHVVPKSRGGTRKLPLCVDCHGKAHDADLRRLQREQQQWRERARAEGRRLGRLPKAITPEQVERVQGLSFARAAAALHIAASTLRSRARALGFRPGPDQRGRRPRRHRSDGQPTLF